MYKKLAKAAFLLSFSLVVSFAPMAKVRANDSLVQPVALSQKIIDPQLEQSSVKDGYVKIRYTNDSDKKMKVIVEKEDNKYYYDFDGKGKYENYPLNMGNGQYNISLLQNSEGKNYVLVDEWKVNAEIKSESTVYSISNKIVDFENSTFAVAKAKELVNGLSSDEDKVKVIYNYVISNIQYDIQKQKTVAAGYTPNIELVVNTGSGICYDFASTYAGMLRSVGIPTKLIMGSSKNVQGYHAWNEVYVNGKWMVVDTSYDSQARAAKAKFIMYKPSADYNNEKEY